MAAEAEPVAREADRIRVAAPKVDPDTDREEAREAGKAEATRRSKPVADRIRMLKEELSLAKLALVQNHEALLEARRAKSQSELAVAGLVAHLRNAGVSLDSEGESKWVLRRRHRSTPTLADLADQVLRRGPKTTEELVEALGMEGREVTANSLNSTLHRGSPSHFIKNYQTGEWGLGDLGGLQLDNCQ